MTLKLEVGKSYRRADGAKCTVDFDDESDFARFRAISETAPRALWYWPDGRCASGSEFNLIAEWEEPSLPHGHVSLPCGKVVDLTNPHGTTFGLLDEVYGAGTQEAMRAHGGPYEVFLHEGRWRRSSNPRWFDGSTYRVAPKREPKVEDLVLFGGRYNETLWAFENISPSKTWHTHRITLTLRDGVIDAGAKVEVLE